MQGSKFGNRAGGHYPEQRMLTPVSIGGCRIHLIPKRGHRTNWIEQEVII